VRNRIIGYGSVAAAVAAALYLVFLASIPAISQNNAPTTKPKCVGCSVDGKTTPRTPDGHPDLSGFWGAVSTTDVSQISDDGSKLYDFSGEGPEEFIHRGDQPQQANQPPYKPEYMIKVKAIADKMYAGATAADPQYSCQPLGIPRGSFGEMQIVQSPQAIVMLRTEGTTDRLIYMDGRSHPPDLETSYMGDSIGHWEGDTLVVDVAGLNDETWLGGSVNGNQKLTSIHSDKEHVVERWTRKGDDLTYEATVEDPVMFSRPWVITPRHIKHGQNDKDLYLFQIPCVPHDEASHIVEPTDKDKFTCIFCQPGEPQAAGTR